MPGGCDARESEEKSAAGGESERTGVSKIRSGQTSIRTADAGGLSVARDEQTELGESTYPQNLPV